MMNEFTQTVRATFLKNGAEIKWFRSQKKDDKPQSIKQLLKCIKNTRRKLRKNLEDEERTHLITVLGDLHEQVNQEELRIAIDREETLLEKGEKCDQKATFYQYIQQIKKLEVSLVL